MNRWRVGEDRGSKEMDGCPLTPVPSFVLEPSVYIVSIVWSFACTLTDILCFLAVSSLLSFGHVVSRIVSRPLNLSVVFVHGGMTVGIFS
jgi:hypothetical protein